MKNYLSSILISLVLSCIAPLTFAQSSDTVGKAKENVSQTQAPKDQVRFLVNINTATAEVIAANVKGIGSKKAAAIVEYREQIGGKFDSLEQLLAVKGIGEALLLRIKTQLTLE